MTSRHTLPDGWPDADERRALRTEIPGADWRDSAPVLSPFSGERVATTPVCSVDDLEAAFASARRAQTDWADRPLDERIAVIERFHDRVVANRERLLDVVQAETGKARIDAVEEVADLLVTCQYYAKVGPEFLRPETRSGVIPFLTRATERHPPRGVVGVISPWNYPISLTLSDIVPALLAGNAVVLKPALETPYTALLGATLLREAGLPPDLLEVVPGGGSTLGQELVERASFVQFTGSTAAGREVAGRAGRSLTPFSLELGGKNPMLVLEDADLEMTAHAAMRGAFSNAGQLCLSVERCYVHESVADAFVDELLDRVRSLELASRYDYGGDVGSLISGEHRDSVHESVRSAREGGATVACGGRPREDVGPWFYEPTVLTGVPDSATLARKETFGPVLSVSPVASTEEAIERANDSEYGLHASVWTRDGDHGEAVARRIRCGTVAVNDAYQAMWGSLDTPMGGMHDSGIGRRHGRDGIVKYTDTQSVVRQRGRPLTAPAGVPNWLAARALVTFAKLRRYLPSP